MRDITISTQQDSRLFAVSIMAWRETNVREIQHEGWAVSSPDLETARSNSLVRALEVWPKRDKWQGHSVDLVEVVITVVEIQRTTSSEPGQEQDEPVM